MAAVEAIPHKGPDFFSSTELGQDAMVWPASDYRDHRTTLCSTSDQERYLKLYAVIGVSTEKSARRPTCVLDGDGDGAAAAAFDGGAELDTLRPSSGCDSGAEEMDGLEKGENDDGISPWKLVPEEDTHTYVQDGKIKWWLDGENDTAMDIEAPFPHAPVERLPLAHPSPISALGFQYLAENLAAPGLDVDMDERQSIEDYDDSSDEEDTADFGYNSWMQHVYNPMFLGHVTLSGQKRREHEHDDNTRDVHKKTETAPEECVAKVGGRQIMQPSLLRRKRVWKASQGTSSSVGESEWSLAVNSPIPPLSTTSSPRMTPIPMFPAQEPGARAARARQYPWRALVRRLRNVCSQSSIGTPGSFTPTSLAPHEPPLFSPIPYRPSPHQYQQTQKRPRYSSNISDRGASPGAFSEGPATPPPFLGAPMDFRANVDGHWGNTGLGMMDVEPDFSPPPAVMGAGPLDPLRAKGLLGVLKGVDDFFGSTQEHQPWDTENYI